MTHQAAVFPDADPVAGQTKLAGVDGNGGTSVSGMDAGRGQASEGAGKVEPCSYLRLFSMSDTRDVIAILAGVAGSLANAPIFPLFALIFGDVRFLSRSHCICDNFAPVCWSHKWPTSLKVHTKSACSSYAIARQAVTIAHMSLWHRQSLPIVLIMHHHFVCKVGVTTHTRGG